MEQNNQLQVFNNEELGLKVKTIQNEDGSISINAEDTAIGFGWCRFKNNKQYVMWDRINRFLTDLDFPHKCGKDDFIPESLFYMLGMKASNNKAKAFQQWLAIDVIPSIRKHGAYMTDKTIEEVLSDPDTIIKLATQLKEERQARKKLEQENKNKEKVIDKLKPQAEIADRFTNDNNSYDMKLFCKVLNIKGLGRNNMFKWLRNQEVLMSDNQPYQKYMNSDYFKVIILENRFNDKKAPKTLVKSKGIKFIVKKLIKDDYIVIKTVAEILEELENRES